MQNILQIRALFPALSSKMQGKPLVYLDNAATAQRPLAVTDMADRLAKFTNANIHRAVYTLASDATAEYEAARDAVRGFINAPSREEIIFTSGTTEAVNLVAHSFGEKFVHEGDIVVVSEESHHSNIVPWQMLCERKKARLEVLEIPKIPGTIPGNLQNLISQKPKIVAISHISNVLGLINPVREIVEICHKNGVPVFVDGAQGVVHSPVDVQELGCDFYAFSGHKIYASTGTGVLFGKKEWLEKMPPFLGGGEMIGAVSFKGTTYAPLPMKFEAGTRNINAVPTLVPAIEFVKECAQNPEVKRSQEEIMQYMLEELGKDPRITLYGAPQEGIRKVPVFSISVEGAHHEDLALILDKMGIAVRSGRMCADPLMDHFGVSGMLRASFAPYNTLEEAEYFIKSLHRAIDMLV